MLTLINLGLVVGAWALLFFVPSLFIASWITRGFRSERVLSSLVLAFVVATHLVPAAMFVAAAFAAVPISPTVAALVALGVTIALRRQARPVLGLPGRLGAVKIALRHDPFAHIAVAVATGFAFTYQALFFDTLNTFHFDCIYRPVAIAAGWLPPGTDGIRNYSLWYADHQRLGVTAVLSPSMSLFGFAGLRFTWGALFACLPLVAFLVGRRLSLTARGAAAGAVIAAGLPWVFGAADQNRVVLSTSTLLALSLALHRPALALTGLAAGLLYAEEPVAILGLGAVPIAMLAHESRAWRRWTAWTDLAVGLLVAATPALARYWLAFGRVAYHEHFSYMPSLPYSLFGIDFKVNAFLNWPLHDHLVRSPYNALPNLALLPARVLRHVSIPVAATALVGFIGLLGRRRIAIPLALLGGFLPVAMGLSVVENWVEREKGDVVIMAYAPLFLAAGAGVDLLLRRATQTRALVGMAAALSLLAASYAALHRIRAPEDERMRASYPNKQQDIPPEDPEYLQFEILRTRPIPWTPRWHYLAEPDARQAGTLLEDLRGLDRARRLLDARARTSWLHALFEGSAAASEVPPAATPAAAVLTAAARADAPAPTPVATVGAMTYPSRRVPHERRLRLDLADPPSRGIGASGGRVVRRDCPGGEPAAVLKLGGGPVQLRVPWNNAPVEVSLKAPPGTDGHHGMIWVRRSELYQRKMEGPLVPGTCLEFRIPAQMSLTLIDILSYVPNRAYTYRLSFDRAAGEEITLELNRR